MITILMERAITVLVERLVDYYTRMERTQHLVELKFPPVIDKPALRLLYKS